MCLSKRFLCFLIVLGSLSVPVFAQNLTTVTATITDPNSLPWSFATIQAQLIPTGITPTINGQQVSGFTRATADVNGTFSMNLASNAVLSPAGTQWQFTVNTSGIAPPAGTGPQGFSFISTGTLISGASVNISTQLSGLAPALSRIVGIFSGSIANTQVAFGSAANTIAGDPNFTWLTANKKLLIGDPIGGLSGSTPLPVGTWALQSIHHNTATTAQDEGVVGIVQADNGVDSINNHIIGGFFRANTLTNLYSGVGNAPIAGVDSAGLSSHPSGTLGQVLGGIFTGYNTSTGGVSDLAGVAGQVSVSGSGAVGSGFSFRAYGPTITGGTPPGSVGGLYVNTMNGGALNYGLFINPQTQDSTHWAIKTGTGLVQFGDTVNAVNYQTATDCAANSVSPAACGSACAGAFVIPTTTTTYTVNTTCPTTNTSHYFLFPRTDNSGLPSAPTCAVPSIASEPVRSTHVNNVSFTVAIASTTGATCWDYLITSN